MYTYNIEVLRVIDGDTIDASIDLGFDVKIKKRIRFMGINTPESRTRDPEEKKRGMAAKSFRSNGSNTATEVQVVSHGVGKFGRCLGEIDFCCPNSLTMKNLNRTLIEEGHAVEYHGGKR